MWAPVAEYAHVLLTVSDPAGVEFRRSFESDEAYRIDPQQVGDAPLRNGVYQYQIVFIERLTEEGGVEGHRQSGAFEVRGARAVSSPVMDSVISDDLIVQGSACVGFDCANGESFGFDTLRLKENNLRIRFQDTSTSASFPTRDWEITINDSSNGGASYFALSDIDGGQVPFRIDAGARSNALRVNAAGRVGVGTASPVLPLHATLGDTPGLRLEQDGSSGYPSQTWDIGANEANFFVRDVTMGSTLPFRIRPGAPTSSLDIQSDGAVLVPQRLLAGFADAATATGDAAVEIEGLTRVDGNLIVSGTVTEGSDRARKTNLIPVDVEAVLARVTALPISSWEWTGSEGARHLGPMAQDFYRAFGLGTDDTHIATVDGAGVALAAIQALHLRNEASTTRIAELEAANARLAERLARIESLLQGAHE
ncbi:tail fiber domain-containing protein [Rubrivirga sp. IMCC43871]|uniref:tail fiber domain-containing protein n=1 Tax=Rubrivirga sp. IMCC43871 TaxID=3391575 RepID=UPI00398FD250